ncbi:carboxymuconolactone decarboxylase family protein [Candidatus Peregrinibacteria bacterium]|nr:carboxymuconolactone decarboxylase family protein [Candidatus Peregrinibacteria bacterium]
MKKRTLKELPRSYQELWAKHPNVANSHKKLVEACKKAGPIKSKNCELIKLAIAVGAGLYGAIHSHTRQALEYGATPDEVRHTVILSTTTIGLSKMMQAKRWIEESIAESGIED